MSGIAPGVFEAQAKASPDVRNVVNFLRSSKSGMKVRVGAYNGKRTDYFKGKSAIKALMSPAYAKLKNVPKIESEEEAKTLLAAIIPHAFYLRVDRGAPSGSTANSPKVLTVNQMQSFLEAEYYAWFYEGSQWLTYVGGFAMLFVMLAGVMFPLWPSVMRLGVWYISMGVLGLIGLFFAVAILRLIFYIITVIVSPGIWIFPKLFADVGFVESFIPLWEWDQPKKKKGKKKDGKSEKSGKSKAATNGATSTAVDVRSLSPDSAGSSRPESRQVRVEEVPDDS
ncbi:translocation protein Sec62-domain-containing protein [Cytidiella melzeri]|nr:translocation protein Sec62-domain-containing protein [Cytidiella melzeri]